MYNVCKWDNASDSWAKSPIALKICPLSFSIFLKWIFISSNVSPVHYINSISSWMSSFKYYTVYDWTFRYLSFSFKNCSDEIRPFTPSLCNWIDTDIFWIFYSRFSSALWSRRDSVKPTYNFSGSEYDVDGGEVKCVVATSKSCDLSV